jgi:hypothetical protein
MPSQDIALNRQAAVLLGLRLYHGLPCTLGHGTVRNMSNNGCADCNRLYGLAHKRANADKEKARKKAYKLANADKVRDERKRHRERHKEALRAKAKVYVATSPTLAAKRLERAWDKEMRDALRACKLERLAAEKQARLAARPSAEEMELKAVMRNRTKASMRRAWKRYGVRKSANAAEKRALYLAQDRCCAYCGLQGNMRAKDMHCDHKLPISGDVKDDSIHNLQWLCAPCNMRKRTTPDPEYRRLNGIPAITPWDAPDDEL